MTTTPPAQAEWNAHLARNTRNTRPSPRYGRTSADSSPPGSASSRASSPASPAMSPVAVPPTVYRIPQTQFDANTGRDR